MTTPRVQADAPVMILAGGTGGHIFPGLAVAAALQARGVRVLWLGAEGGMETRLVPPRGIAIDTIRLTAATIAARLTHATAVTDDGVTVGTRFDSTIFIERAIDEIRTALAHADEELVAGDCRLANVAIDDEKFARPAAKPAS